MPLNPGDRGTSNRSTSSTEQGVSSAVSSISPTGRGLQTAAHFVYSPDFESVKKRLRLCGYDLISLKETKAPSFEARELKYGINFPWLELDYLWENPEDKNRTKDNFKFPTIIDAYPNLLEDAYSESLPRLNKDLGEFGNWFWKKAKEGLLELAKDVGKLGDDLLQIYQIHQESSSEEGKQETLPIVDFHNRLNLAISEKRKLLQDVVGLYNPKAEEFVKTWSSEKDRKLIQEGEKNIMEFVYESTFEHKIFAETWKRCQEKLYWSTGYENIDITQTKDLIGEVIAESLLGVANSWQEKLEGIKDEALEKVKWRIFDAYLILLIKRLKTNGDINDQLEALCNKIIQWNFENVKEWKEWLVEYAQMGLMVLSLCVPVLKLSGKALQYTLAALSSLDVMVNAEVLRQAVAFREEIKTYDQLKLIEKTYQVSSDMLKAQAEGDVGFASVFLLVSVIDNVSVWKNSSHVTAKTMDGLEDGKYPSVVPPNPAKTKPKAEPVDPKTTTSNATSVSERGNSYIGTKGNPLKRPLNPKEIPSEHTGKPDSVPRNLEGNRSIANIPKSKLSKSENTKRLIEEWEKVNDKIERIPIQARTHKHHVFPQAKKLEKHWKRVGINIDGYTVQVTDDFHLKVLHQGEGGGRWNDEWEIFFEEFPNASREVIFEKMERMRGSFGIDNLQFHEY